MDDMILLGLAVIAGCTVIYSALFSVFFRLFHWAHGRVHGRKTFLHDTAFVSVVVACLLLGNLLQVLVWGIVFVLIGAFDTLELAYYFALTSFTTVGYGNVVLTGPHAILGPLAAAHGVLMLGLSTSILFWVISTLLHPLAERYARLYGETDEDGRQQTTP
ncbi:ion channel [Acuticoccus sp. M5D2P5]|uniref:ion channel n=1 Tax=Acuticoccus kalidii TaxID=2910977 RepID=UPI001F3E8E9B|nr:ion channel [Acuticoccus kalidii]MCF3933177.1 ion channel [Acuticoccus kalidii]